MNSETTVARDPLAYWGVGDVDQPIGLVTFPCGRHVCPNHGDDQGESPADCEPSVARPPRDPDGPMGRPAGPFYAESPRPDGRGLS